MSTPTFTLGWKITVYMLRGIVSALDTATLSPTCDDQWEKRNAFKYGSFYYCKKCHKESLKIIKKKI